MSHAQDLEILCLPGVLPGKPTLDEIALIAAMLPELMLLMQTLDDSDAD